MVVSEGQKEIRERERQGWCQKDRCAQVDSLAQHYRVPTIPAPRSRPEFCSKSFRTLKANIVFQEELDKRTNCDDNTDAKIQTYVEANKKVALLLNHQNVVSKVYKKSIEKLYSDIKSKAKKTSENGNDEGGVRRTVVQRLTA
jgi:hypothetical protein